MKALSAGLLALSLMSASTAFADATLNIYATCTGSIMEDPEDDMLSPPSPATVELWADIEKIACAKKPLKTAATLIIHSGQKHPDVVLGKLSADETTFTANLGKGDQVSLKLASAAVPSTNTAATFTIAGEAPATLQCSTTHYQVDCK